MSEKIKLTVILDTIGRTILGELVESSDDILSIKNPVVLNIQADNSGRMSVQLLPLFFREFLADKNEDVVFCFNRNSITPAKDVVLDFRLQAQYSQLFGKSNIFIPPTNDIGSNVATQGQNTDNKIVKLFDNE